MSGKLTGYNFNQFQVSKENLTEPGFEPKASGLTYQHSYQLGYPAPYWRSPKFKNLSHWIKCGNQTFAKIQQQLSSGDPFIWEQSRLCKPSPILNAKFT